MSYPELQLGLNPVPWQNMFVRQLLQLGPNLWLTRFTRDKLGKSPVEYLGLVMYHDADEAHRKGFITLGIAKRNRKHRDRRAIDLYISNWGFSPGVYSWDEVRTAQFYLLDTDEDWRRAASLLVINGRLLLPTEAFYEYLDDLRFPDYGDITGA